MEQSPVTNAASLVGEIFLPGASQYVAGNVGSGLVHSLLAMGAGAMLMGVSPVVGTLAVLGIKLNSYSSATTGRNLWDLGSEAVNRASNRFQTARGTSATSATGSANGTLHTSTTGAPK